jgi:hypothetical protein
VQPASSGAMARPSIACGRGTVSLEGGKKNEHAPRGKATALAGDERRTAVGGHPHRWQDCGRALSAGGEPHVTAAARHERRRLRVGSSALLGTGSATDFRCASLVYNSLLAGAPFLSGGHRRPLGGVMSQFAWGAISVA